jgi:hypothetical protein
VESGHGPIDLLCADPDGRIVIVEFKRGTENPDICRLVAQLLDYGAGLWRTSLDELQRRCMARVTDGDRRPWTERIAASFASIGVADFDEERFVSGLSAALGTGDFTFMYPGRDLDRRSQRIMTYLAEGPRMRFIGVEVDRYRSGDRTTDVLVPRTAFVPSWVAVPAAPPFTSITEAFELASEPVRQLRDLLDAYAAERELIAESTHRSRLYRPAPRHQGVAIYPSSGRADLNLESFRTRGEDAEAAEADEFVRRLQALAGPAKVERVWPGVGCAELVKNWDQYRAEILDPYFDARARHSTSE